MKIRIPEWLKKNAPAIFTYVAEYLAKRKAKADAKKSALWVITVLLLVGCGFKIPPCIKDGSCLPKPSPLPSPLPSPSPSPSPESSPSPLPEASPSPSPVPTAAPTPAPSVVCPTPGPGEIIAPGYSDEYKAPKRDKCYAPVKADSNINWNDCGTCAFTRDYNVRQGHWIDFGHPKGWLRANGSGPDFSRFITRDCDYVFEDGRVIRTRESGGQGNICPREVDPVSVASPLPPSSPLSSPGSAPPLTASGNFPIPAPLTCPAHFKAIPFSLHIKVNHKTCGESPECIKALVSVTQRVGKPGLEHYCVDETTGVYVPGSCANVFAGEMWRPCQEPQFIDYQGGGDNPGNGIVLLISHPDWGNRFERMDKWTCDPRNDACPPGMVNPVHNYNGQDRASHGRSGLTTIKACMPDRSICAQTTYHMDRSKLR